MYRDKILGLTERYYRELNASDFSHNFDHILRVERLAKRIAQDEGADLEIIEAASLLFDVARGMEDRGEIEDHAEEGAKIAKEVLSQIEFPMEKIEAVCHAVLVHRRSKDRKPASIEAKILQDADYLDAMGAVDVARVIASKLQSQKYGGPIYVDEPFTGDADVNKSAIHFMLYKINHPKHQPNDFHTKLGRQLAQERFNFMKEYADRFIAEWRGEK